MSIVKDRLLHMTVSSAGQKSDQINAHSDVHTSSEVDLRYLTLFMATSLQHQDPSNNSPQPVILDILSHQDAAGMLSHVPEPAN
jgi:hypothetical protein